MDEEEFMVRNALDYEFQEIGELLVNVYSRVEGFPKQDEKPEYYEMLANVENFIKYPKTEILVSVSENNKIAGAVVYFGDMQYYNSPGIATKEIDAAGFRLLAVDNSFKGKGIGRMLTLECIKKGRLQGVKQIIIHTTESMKIAWKMYESLGFIKSENLDFTDGTLHVFGFRLHL